MTVETDLLAEAGKRIMARGTCIDVGPGIAPQRIAQFDQHYCIEPHVEYVEWLRNAGYRVAHASAKFIWSAPLWWDIRPGDDPVVFYLDVIEHIDAPYARKSIAAAQEFAKQIIIFTPLGFYPQSYAEGEKDAWGMNGTYWQTHRSGWTPDDFPGWEILVEPEAHEGHGAFVAIWSR